MATLLEGLFGPLGTLPIPRTAPWPSEISDDASPYELSLVPTPGAPEVRVLWESQGPSGDLKSKMRAGLETQRRLCERFGARSDRFTAIADLFLPEEPEGKFVIWHAARLWPLEAKPELKIYLNPQARGRIKAGAVVEEALERLGFRGVWPVISEAMPRGPELDEILYFSLDLWAGEAARVKIYLQHHNPTDDVLRAVAGASPNADPEAVVAFYHAITADRPALGSFEVIYGDALPPAGVSPGSCLSFTSASLPRPVAMTLHVPVRSHVTDDSETFERASAAFSPESARLHRLAVEAVRQRPLETGRGLTAVMSLRSQGAKSRNTCYLSAEAFSPLPKPSSQARAMPAVPPLERMVELYEEERRLNEHPFFQRMKREPVAVQHLWLMFANGLIGASEPFPRWVSHTIHNVEDPRIRAVLAEQLYEELGSGDPDRNHAKLMGQLLEAIGAWKPANVGDAMYEPGRRMARRLDGIYYDPQPYTAVGASIVSELLGKQADHFVGEQFRRQQEVGTTSAEWLLLHEALEVDHANESLLLARYVEDEEHRRAAWRGGRLVYATAWQFFTDLYALCFCGEPLQSEMKGGVR